MAERGEVGTRVMSGQGLSSFRAMAERGGVSTRVMSGQGLSSFRSWAGRGDAKKTGRLVDGRNGTRTRFPLMVEKQDNEAARRGGIARHNQRPDTPIHSPLASKKKT